MMRGGEHAALEAASKHLVRAGAHAPRLALRLTRGRAYQAGYSPFVRRSISAGLPDLSPLPRQAAPSRHDPGLLVQ